MQSNNKMQSPPVIQDGGDSGSGGGGAGNGGGGSSPPPSTPQQSPESSEESSINDQTVSSSPSSTASSSASEPPSSNHHDQNTFLTSNENNPTNNTPLLPQTNLAAANQNEALLSVVKNLAAANQNEELSVVENLAAANQNEELSVVENLAATNQNEALAVENLTADPNITQQQSSDHESLPTDDEPMTHPNDVDDIDDIEHLSQHQQQKQEAVVDQQNTKINQKIEGDTVGSRKRKNSSPSKVELGMFPVRVVVSRIADGDCPGCAVIDCCDPSLSSSMDQDGFAPAAFSMTDKRIITDSYAILSGHTPLSQLVPTVLSAMGLQNLVFGAKGLIQLKGWKALSFDEISDDPDATVEVALKDLSSHLTLRIVTKDGEYTTTDCVAAMKQRLLKTNLAKHPNVLTTINNAHLQEFVQNLIEGTLDPMSITSEHVKGFNNWLEDLDKATKISSSTDDDPRGVGGERSTFGFNDQLEIPKLRQWFRENSNPTRRKLMQYMHIMNSTNFRRHNKIQITYQHVCNWFLNARAANNSLRQVFKNGNDEAAAASNTRGEGGRGLNMMDFNELIRQTRKRQVVSFMSSPSSNGVLGFGGGSLLLNNEVDDSSGGEGTKSTSNCSDNSESFQSPTPPTPTTENDEQQLVMMTGDYKKDVGKILNNDEATTAMDDDDILMKSSLSTNQHRQLSTTLFGSMEQQRESSSSTTAMDLSSSNPLEHLFTSPSTFINNNIMSQQQRQQQSLSNQNRLSDNDIRQQQQQQQQQQTRSSTITTPSSAAAAGSFPNVVGGGGKSPSNVSLLSSLSGVVSGGLMDPSTLVASLAALAGGGNSNSNSNSASSLFSQLTSAQQQQILRSSLLYSSLPATGRIGPVGARNIGPPTTARAAGNSNSAVSSPSCFTGFLTKNSESSSVVDNHNGRGGGGSGRGGGGSQQRRSGGGRGDNINAPNSKSSSSTTAGSGGGPPGRSRLMFDPLTELPLLERWFDENPHPSWVQIEQFTGTLNNMDYRSSYPPVSTHNVKIWFKNRRAKCKRLFGTPATPSSTAAGGGGGNVVSGLSSPASGTVVGGGVLNFKNIFLQK